MKHLIQLLVLGTIVGVIFLLWGCTEDAKNPVSESAQTVLQTLQPKGTISGKIFDRCTGDAISGAVMSVGWDDAVHSTVTDASGSFAFADVPAGRYITCPTCTVFTGTYTLTASLVDYNSQQSDSSKRYKDFTYWNVTITFTSLVPGDSLGVSGLVGAVTCSLSTLSTTVKGTIVNQALQPVAGANVVIFDHFATPYAVIGRAVTGTDGSFLVGNIENGIAIDVEARSADGSTEGSRLNFSIPCNLGEDSIRAQVSTEQIVLAPVDNVAPYVTNITPENMSDVSTTASFVYTFSEPIAQNTYTVTNLGVGHGTIVDDIVVTFTGLKKAQAALPTPTVAWNPTFTALTVTPNGLAVSSKYTISIATLIGKLKDRRGNVLVANTVAPVVGDNEVLNFTTAGGTTGPAAPVLSRRSIPNVLAPLNYNGGTVGLMWTASTGARSYNLYRSVGSSTSFELLRRNVYSIIDTNLITSLCSPSGATNPLSAISIRYYVRAVSADLVEGTASNIYTVSDETKPQLNSIDTPPAGGILPNYWRYTLRFSEPLNIANAENTLNYLVVDPDSVDFHITDADYLGYVAGPPAQYLVQLVVTSDLLQPAGYSIKALSGITDLAGLAMDTTADMYTFSAPPSPTLSSPANGATGLTLPVTLTWLKPNGAVSYRLQVSTGTGGAFNAGIVFDSDNLPVHPLTTTSYAVSDAYLTPGITYYWRVNASNGATPSTSGYSVERNFQP